METRIVEIEKTATNGAIAGFYVTDSDCDPSDWLWNDRGNGPELVDPLGFGPFPTEEAAENWITDQSPRGRVMTLDEVEAANLGADAIESAGKYGGERGVIQAEDDGYVTVTQQCRTFVVPDFCVVYDT